MEETPLGVALGLVTFALAVIMLNALIHRVRVRRNNSKGE